MERKKIHWEDPIMKLEVYLEVLRVDISRKIVLISREMIVL